MKGILTSLVTRYVKIFWVTLIFEKVTRDAVDLVTAIMVSFTTYFSQADIIRKLYDIMTIQLIFDQTLVS